MSKRFSPEEMVFPSSLESIRLACEWAAFVSFDCLNLVWLGYDELLKKYLPDIDWSKDPIQVERTLAHWHFLEITLLWKNDGFSSIQPSHEMPEPELSQTPSAKPPAMDLGFLHIENRSWKWPIEVKLIKTPKALAPYRSDVKKFEDGIAGRLVSEGGMIGYLLSGSERTTLETLQKKLNQTLQPVSKFTHRHHRTSEHSRSTAPDLHLHHMIMKCKN